MCFGTSGCVLAARHPLIEDAVVVPDSVLLIARELHPRCPERLQPVLTMREVRIFLIEHRPEKADLSDVGVGLARLQPPGLWRLRMRPISRLLGKQVNLGDALIGVVAERPEPVAAFVRGPALSPSTPHLESGSSAASSMADAARRISSSTCGQVRVTRSSTSATPAEFALAWSATGPSGRFDNTRSSRSGALARSFAGGKAVHAG